jgi:hypothetical protein
MNNWMTLVGLHMEYVDDICMSGLENIYKNGNKNDLQDLDH